MLSVKEFHPYLSDLYVSSVDVTDVTVIMGESVHADDVPIRDSIHLTNSPM